MTLKLKDVIEIKKEEAMDIALQATKDVVVRALKLQLPRHTGKLRRSVRARRNRNGNISIYTYGPLPARQGGKIVHPGVYGFINRKVRESWNRILSRSSKKLHREIESNLGRL